VAQGKRANREGSIYRERSTGDWRGAVTLADGSRRRIRGRTKAEAKAKVDELRGLQAAGLPVGSTDRLDGFARWWLGTLDAKAVSGQKSTNTVDNSRWALETWVVPALGARRLIDLEPEDVENLLAKMATGGMSRSSLIRVRSVLGQALHVAEKRGKVLRNVARLAEMPATKAPAARRSLTVEEASSLLEAIRGDRLEALYLTALMLGLRPGEVTGLRWEDLNGSRLSIEVSMKNERGRLRLGATKTPRSRRALQVPPPVADALSAHSKRQKVERLTAGPEWVDTGLIFTTPFGTPIDPSNLRHAFAKVTERAGIGRWTLNELRHSAASLLSADGVPLEVIADMLGHTSTRMLEAHYRHPTRPVIDAHVAVMTDLFGSGQLRSDPV
jgi:integrase